MSPLRRPATRPLLTALLIALQVLVPLLCAAAPPDRRHGTDRAAAVASAPAPAEHGATGDHGAEHVHGECAAIFAGLLSPPDAHADPPLGPARAPRVARAPAPTYHVPSPVPIPA